MTRSEAITFAETVGMVRLHIDLKLDVSQLATWTPERISALFDGIAQVQGAVKGELTPATSITNNPLSDTAELVS